MGQNLSIPVYERVFGPTARLPPNFVEPFAAQNVHLENFSIMNSPFWTVHPTYSTNVIVRGLSIDTKNTKNSDGCDPEGSVDVLVERNAFDTGDDCVAIKAGRDADGRRVGRPTRNVVVRDNTCRSTANGFCVGSEVSGGVDNVYFINNTINKASGNAVYFKSNLDRGSWIRRITLTNLSADGLSGRCVYFANDYTGVDRGGFPTDFRHFDLRNISCTLDHDDDDDDDVKGAAIDAVGVDDDHPIADVLIENLAVLSSSSDNDDDDDAFIHVDHVEDFRLVNVTVNGQRVDRNYSVGVVGDTRSHEETSLTHVLM